MIKFINLICFCLLWFWAQVFFLILFNSLGRWWVDDLSVMSSYYFMHFMKTTILCLTSRLSESLSRNWWVQNYIVFCFFISPLLLTRLFLWAVITSTSQISRNYPVCSIVLVWSFSSTFLYTDKNYLWNMKFLEGGIRPLMRDHRWKLFCWVSTTSWTFYFLEPLSLTFMLCGCIFIF